MRRFWKFYFVRMIKTDDQILIPTLTNQSPVSKKRITFKDLSPNIKQTSEMDSLRTLIPDKETPRTKHTQIFHKILPEDELVEDISRSLINSKMASSPKYSSNDNKQLESLDKEGLRDKQVGDTRTLI